MTKMNIAAQDRYKARLECMRLIRTLKLDPARSKLIGVFMESYLKLTATQMREFEREMAKLSPSEQEETMEIMTSWERKGYDEGISQGKEGLVVRLIGKRFGSEAPQVAERLDRLTSDQLDELGLALLDFTEPAELDNWLAQRIPQ